jgi:hypothetical protein
VREVRELLRKLLAVLSLAVGLAGIFGAAPASADPLISFDNEGEVDPDRIGNSDNLACINPHIEVFDNVLLEDPICV